VVSDFGLIEAVESGLVKIPFLAKMNLSAPSAFGLWRDEPVNALDYQQAIRKEWDEE
jgi:hypothetical protein